MTMRQRLGIDGFAMSAPIGKELFLYHNDSKTTRVYNLAKDEWRHVKRSWVECFESLAFIIEGKFYLLSESRIDVYDGRKNSWIKRHTHSFATFRPDDSVELVSISILVVKDELHLLAYWNISSWKLDEKL